MANQRRSRPTTTTKKPATRTAPVRKARPSLPRASVATPATAAAGKAPSAGRVAATPPAGPSSRESAVVLFERGFRSLQQREFAGAAALLRSVIASFPEEKELHERARVYLAICERQMAPATAPRTFEERVCAATLAINRGAYDEGLKLLQGLEREAP
jgi:hypothetical protein